MQICHGHSTIMVIEQVKLTDYKNLGVKPTQLFVLSFDVQVQPVQDVSFLLNFINCSC